MAYFQNLQAIILAAGKGTRMNSALPKVLHRICGRTLLWKSLSAVASVKAERVSVVVGYGESDVKAELSRFSATSPLRVESVFQSEQLGTGHAVQIALSSLDETKKRVLILPGDLPLITGAALDCLSKIPSNVSLTVLTCEVPDPTGFGRIIRDPQGEIIAIREERDCSSAERQIREINTGIYLCSLQFLQAAVGSLRPDNSQKEYYLTDIVQFGVRQKLGVQAEKALDFVPFLGTNTRNELAALEEIRRSEIVAEMMLAGVSFEDPRAVYLDEDVTIGQDSFIGAGTRLFGKTTVGKNVRIDGQCRIVDTVIGDGVHVKLNCVMDSSIVEHGCAVGPFAHLRPGSVLRHGVHVGNFVETKKAELHPGAKANHLTYLGDCIVGKEANVGAGTITCNYDGFHKHQTVIGAGAFIGSNSSLVAPVEIGAGAVIGAGSVVTKNVQGGALAVERAELKIIPEWAAKNRAQKSKKA